MTIFAEMGDLETLGDTYKLVPALRYVQVVIKYKGRYRGIEIVTDDLEDMRELALLLSKPVSTVPKDGSALGQAWHIPSFLDTGTAAKNDSAV